MRVIGCFVFFFNQKTAYEMRISDWSSDVCSSDLVDLPEPYLPDDSDFRGQLASRLARIRVPARTEAVTELPAVDHPVARCPDVDAHLRAFDRARRLQGEVDELTRRIERQTSTLSIQFDRVLDVLGRRSEGHTS